MKDFLNLRSELPLPWMWGILFLFYFANTFLSAVYFFYHESMMYQYYQILIAYDLYFFIPYLLNTTSVILNSLSLVPFYCFLFKIDFLNKNFWKYFLLARLTADLTGRSYEWQLIKSLLYHDWRAALSLGGTIALIAIPSYCALFLLAFPKTQKNR